MRIKILNGLLLIDILTVLLVLVVAIVPINVIRIVLGLPFLLFFPGYTLVSALFPRNEALDRIEKIALSLGMSIAVVALIGLGLNYTPWGIRLEPVLYSISAFIIIMSFVALLRRRNLRNANLISEYHLKVPGWEGGTFNKTLTVVLSAAILGAVGVLAYTIAVPKVGEKFTEFYILGLQGKAADYPAEFTLRGNQVIGVKYGESSILASSSGKVTLGVVNHEQKKTSYSVVLQIDNQAVNVLYGGKSQRQLEIGPLEQDGKWEAEISFVPLHTGDNQKVEFLLYKDGDPTPENTLHLWINVKAE